jgi:hypothetical protein
MEWQHKGITFHITFERMGPLVMASARAPREGMFVRVRPFSAIGRSEEEALELLRSQIRMEYRRVPDLTAAG